MLCLILFAASGVLLHAAPIQKLPDEEEPEESGSVVKKLPDEEPEKASDGAEESANQPGEKKGAKTEAEAIKVITERLDRMIYPYLPLQRSQEPLLNRDLSDEVVPSWRLIYVKPFDKPQDEAKTETPAATAAEDDEDELKEDFAAITLIPVKSIRLSNALKLGAVGKPQEAILQPLFRFGQHQRHLHAVPQRRHERRHRPDRTARGLPRHRG